jgi:diguanylate cyclase (GGDEF)-like protein
VYRYGGEEFLVLMPEQSAIEAAAAVERVRRAVSLLQIPTISHRGMMTVSIGIAALDGDASVGQWVERADQALYEAKRLGKNCIVFASTHHG